MAFTTILAKTVIALFLMLFEEKKKQEISIKSRRTDYLCRKPRFVLDHGKTTLVDKIKVP